MTTPLFSRRAVAALFIAREHLDRPLARRLTATSLSRFMSSNLQLNERQTADFEMIGNGGFAPLPGPQGSADWKSVVEDMTLAGG